MKLSKAIEILTLDVKGDTTFSYDDWQDALKLGIEALKRVKLQQQHPIKGFPHPLPGEDPEPTARRSLHHIKKLQESPLGREPDLHQPPGDNHK